MGPLPLALLALAAASGTAPARITHAERLKVGFWVGTFGKSSGPNRRNIQGNAQLSAVPAGLPVGTAQTAEPVLPDSRA